MTKAKIRKFVKELLTEFLTKTSPKDGVSFWEEDSRRKLLGEWYCKDRPSMVMDFGIRENYFVINISEMLESDISVRTETYPLHNGDADRLFYFIRNGKIEELVFDGYFDGEGEEDGAYLEWHELSFYRNPGSKSFYEESQKEMDESILAMDEDFNSSNINP